MATAPPGQRQRRPPEGAYQAVVRGYDRLIKGMMGVAMPLIPLSGLVVTYEVVMRYAFNSPTVWAVDLTSFGLLWTTFLAAPWLLRMNHHIVISFFFDKFPRRVQEILRGILYVMAGAATFLLAKEGLSATTQAYATNALTAGSWEIPKAYVWVVIPIGSTLLTIEFARGALLSFLGKPVRPGTADESTPAETRTAF